MRQLWEFDGFRLDGDRRVLLKGTDVVQLPSKAFDILLVLVDRRGEVVSKKELMEAIWPECFVEEANLTQNIHLVRKALGEGSKENRYIATVPGRGYCFVAGVEQVRGRDEATTSLVHDNESNEEGKTDAKRSWQASGAARRGILHPKPLSRRVFWNAATVGLVLFVMIGLVLMPDPFSSTRLSLPLIPPRARGRVTLAVRPFKDLDPDPAWEFVAAGLTEEMVTRLGQLHPQQMLVVPLTPAPSYAAAPPERLAKDIRADYVLEGGVRKIAGRVAITAQLIQVSSESVVWGQHYEREVKDLLRVQEEVAAAITGEVLNSLPHTAVPVREVNRKAYLAYLEGRYFWDKRTTESLTRARALFQKSIAIDPSYAPSYAGLAYCYELLGSAPYTALPPNEAFPKAEAAAKKALELDNTLSEAHVVLGYSEMVYDLNLSEAREEFSVALQLHPDYPIGHQFYAYYLTVIGDLKGAIRERRRALELDPVNPMLSSALGEAYYQNREFDRAIDHNTQSLELDPSYAIALVNIGRAYEMKGMHAEARGEFQKVLAASPSDPAVLALMGNEYASSGDRTKALQTIFHLQQLSAHGYVAPMYMALVYAGLHDLDNAFVWLNRAAEEHCEYLLYLPSEPLADPLRTDPRFQQLLNRLGLKSLGVSHMYRDSLCILPTQSCAPRKVRMQPTGANFPTASRPESALDWRVAPHKGLCSESPQFPKSGAL